MKPGHPKPKKYNKQKRVNLIMLYQIKYTKFQTQFEKLLKLVNLGEIRIKLSTLKKTSQSLWMKIHLKDNL